MFNLSINEDLRTIQNRFPQLSVQGLHDDNTIVAKKRTDFGLLIEAALFMGPILEEQGSRMNMRKSRFMYYGASTMPEETQEAIKKAGLTFVTRDSTISGEARKQHYIHGVPVGPNSDGIAEMHGTVGRKGENTEFGENHAAASSRCNGGAHEDRLCNDELHHEMLHTRRSQKGHRALRRGSTDVSMRDSTSPKE
jgi:hypothetical protein